MNDDLFRLERIYSSIKECIGVFQAYELNFAETAKVLESLTLANKIVFEQHREPE